MNTSDVNNPTTEPCCASNIANEKWYLTTLSAITTTPELHLCGQLYLYLISQHAYSTTTARSELIRRMREVLFKDIALVGLPKPAEALLSITQFMSEEDGECSFTREGWQCDEANHARGWVDFGFWVADITYGLLLSDRRVLDDVDTEMVVLPAAMSQDMPRMTYWHIRGTRRLGISKEDVQMECVRLVVEACGVTLKQVPSVDDVDKDL
ncbi:unnamed protein product [Penicillium nalgiovense]|nr:unnamed protein product [Penicillium nalgiovense]